MEFESRGLLKRLNVMTREDVKVLSARIATLSKKVDEVVARRQAVHDGRVEIVTPRRGVRRSLITETIAAAAPRRPAASTQNHEVSQVTPWIPRPRREPPRKKNVQEELKDSVHRIWLAGLGALAAAEEEGGKIFSRLVERGRDVESRGKVEVDKVKSEVDKMQDQGREHLRDLGRQVRREADVDPEPPGRADPRRDPQPDAEGRGAQRQDRAAQAARDAGRRDRRRRHATPKTVA